MSVVLSALMTAGALAAAKDPSLLFVSDFDAYSVRAKLGKGGVAPHGFGEESLQLRMWPGAHGNVNSLAFSKSETCGYPLKGNFDPRQGTVSFWVCSLGWKPSDGKFHWFVTARQPGFNLHVYKYMWSGHLRFYIDHPGKGGQLERHSCGAIIEDKDWTEGKWHKLDAVWNETGMKLYVDGVLPRTSPKCDWLKSTLAFPEAVRFPEADAKGEIVINQMPVKSGAEKDERTAIDDVRIWSRPLSDKEIRDAYTAVVPSAFGEKREKCVLAIPRKTADVTLDGRIDGAEWADASVVPMANVPSFSVDKETALRGTVRVKRDAENLYLALSSNRPAKYRWVTEHDGPLWDNDSFEVLLSRDAKTHHLIVNAVGAVYDDENSRPSWESGAKAVASETEDGWQVEMAIPLAALGGLPTSGNFGVVAYRSKAHCDADAAAWSMPGGAFDTKDRFGRFVAVEKPVSLLGIGDPAGGEIALEVKGEAGFEAFVERENGDKVTCGGSLGKDTWRYTPEPGKQRLVVAARLKNGVEALRWETVYYVNRDIEVTYNCHTYDWFVEATATLAGKVAKRLAADGKVEGAFQVVRKSDGKVIFETQAVATTPTVSGRISVSGIEAGDYLVVARFGGDSASKRFNMPDLSAVAEKVGCEHTVPQPWHEVRKAGGQTWEVLDRTYAFGEGPFPKSIVSRGSELFVNPPTMRLDGKEVEWSGFRVTETQPDNVKFAGRGKLGGFEFCWKSELWFDGYYLVTLGMRGEGSLSSLVLDYAVPREFARYVFRQGYRPDGLFQWKNDRIEKTFNPLTHPDESLHWTAGIEKGFAFGCVSDANWANKPDEPNVILTRDAAKATLAAKIISRPVVVTKPLEWQFVMQGTPARRLRREWRSDNDNGYRVPTMQNLQNGGYGEANFVDRNTPDRWTSISNYRFMFPERFLEGQRKARERRDAGVKPKWQTKSHRPYFGLSYCMPMHVATNEPEYDWFYHDAAKRPAITWGYKVQGVGQTAYCVCDTRVYDIYLKNMEWFLKNSQPSQGLYNDCAHTMNCDNERHGHGGIDAFGKKFSSVCWLNQRDYFLREYRIARKYDRIVKNHIPASDFVPFVMDFSDLVWPGEETYRLVLENLDCYTESIPVEAWQSVFNAEIKGVGHNLLPQYSRAEPAMPEATRRKCDFMHNPEWAERTLAAALPHDVAVSASWICYKTVDKWWIVKENLKLWEATFHGYWYDETLKTATDRMYVSWYELPKDAEYRYLVIASNFTRRDAPLGIVGLPWRHAAVRELWNGRNVDDGELQTLTVPAKKFVLLGVK